MEYYSAIKKNEILSFATIWMDLESIMLSEAKLMFFCFFYCLIKM